MSSRWDALKPQPKQQQPTRNNNDKKIGGNTYQRKQHSSTTSSNNKGGGHYTGRTAAVPPSKGGATQRSWRKSSATEYPIGDSATTRTTRTGLRANNVARRQDKQTSSSPSLEWDKLTRELWEWGKESQSEGATNNGERISRILEDLSNLMITATTDHKDSGKTTSFIINGDHRTAAILGAWHAMDSLQDNAAIIGEILNWSCKLLAADSNDGDNLLSSPTNNDELRLTALQGQTCLSRLLRVQLLANENAAMLPNYLECCFHSLKWFASQLPAEATAHQMVGPILLPILEHHFLRSPTATGNYSDALQVDMPNYDVDNPHHRLVLLGIQALRSLLRLKKHSSALLAPLVNDVDDANGQEVYLVNPLRKRIFKVLQSALMELSQVSQTGAPSSVVVNTTYYCAIQCLTAALQMATAMDNPSSSPPPSSHPSKHPHQQQKHFSDLDMLIMETFFKDMIHSDFFSAEPTIKKHRTCAAAVETTRIQVLELLLSYLRKYPDASLSLASVFLFRDDRQGGVQFSSTSICANCKCIHSAYLELLHGSHITVEENGLIMSSLAILVANVPWQLWLGMKSTHENQRLRHQGPTTNFSTRVSESIRSIVLVSRCCLKTQWDSLSVHHSTARSIDPIISLVRATLLEIPYSCFDNDDSSMSDHQGTGIIKAAFELVETLASKVLEKERRRVLFNHRISDVLEDTMGGRITPQGFRTAMIVPTRRFLSSSSSRFFLNRLCQDISIAAQMSNDEGVSLLKSPVRIFRSIVRSRPHVVLANEHDWEQFRAIIGVLCGYDMLHLFGLQLLEGLLQGRKFVVESGSQCKSDGVIPFALSLLPRMVKNSSATCRCVCFQAYGSLLGTDWLLLTDGDVEISMKEHVESILAHCDTIEPAPPVRAASWKAIADICNSFLECVRLSASDDASVADLKHRQEQFMDGISRDLCTSMLKGMGDVNATVRSMAVFAVGNLAQVVGQLFAETLMLEPAHLRNTCIIVYESMNDSNEKVAGNGIRSIGHLMFLILHADYYGSLKNLPWDVDEFCAQVVSALAEKVDQVPSLLQENNRSTLSWRQRSATKKHGRVSCNSLAVVLEKWSSADATVDAVVTWVARQKAVASIANCIECLGGALDDKVLVSAMTAMLSLSSSDLAGVSGRSGIIGRSLVSCILYIAKEQWSRDVSVPTGRLHVHTDLLLKHLVDSASIMDAAIVISCEEIADSWMENLYEWMVSKSCSARAFDIFALALQRPGLYVPVAVERKFANRAMNLLRNEGHEDQSDDEL